ncbi:hydrolase [Enterobacter bugandensis]
MSHPHSSGSNASDKTRVCYHSRWVTFLSILFSSVATIVIWVLFFQTSLSAGFSSYLGIHNEYFLQHPHAKMDGSTLQKIGELVANGTLLSLDDLWSFQGTFYQTIITVLIALNAILGGFAFFMIKQSSNAKAREEATEEVKRYIESKSFDKEVKDITNTKVEHTVNDKIGSLQLDLASQIEFISTLTAEFESEKNKSDKITFLENELLEMKRHISLLATVIAQLDKSEDDDSSLILK